MEPIEGLVLKCPTCHSPSPTHTTVVVVILQEVRIVSNARIARRCSHDDVTRQFLNQNILIEAVICIPSLCCVLLVVM